MFSLDLRWIFQTSAHLDVGYLTVELRCPSPPGLALPLPHRAPGPRSCAGVPRILHSRGQGHWPSRWRSAGLAGPITANTQENGSDMPAQFQVAAQNQNFKVFELCAGGCCGPPKGPQRWALGWVGGWVNRVCSCACLCACVLSCVLADWSYGRPVGPSR